MPPAGLQNGLPDFVIPNAVAQNLRPPEFLACARQPEKWTGVPVPEAPVHEDRSTVFRQDQIRATGNLLRVQPEPEAQPVQSAADQTLRLRVAAPDTSHHPAAGRRVDDINQLRAPFGSCRKDPARPRP